MEVATKNGAVPILRFKGFEKSWNDVSIGKILKIGSGKDYKHLQEGEVPVFGTGGLMAKVNKPLFSGETIFIGRKGSIDKPFHYEGDFWTVDTLFYTYDFVNTNPKFVYALFQKINWYQYNEASGVPSLSKKTIESIKLNIPQSEEQQKIASFLTSVDKKIQQLTKKVKDLTQYKKGVMQQIFKQKSRFKDDNGNDFEDWRELQLSDFLITTLREVPTPKEHYLAIGIRSHCKGTFQKPNSDPSKIMMDKLFTVKENDLIVNITFAWEGAIAMVKKEDQGGHVSHRFPTYTFNRDLVIHEFFKYIIIQKKFRNILDLISPGGAGRNRVMSKKEFVKTKWSMPCIQEQTKIANFLFSIDKKIEQANTQLAQTQQFKKALLQQMFV